MKRFLNTGFVLVVLAAASALSRQNDPAQGSAIAQGESGWKTVEPGMELRFLEARKEGAQNNSRIAVLRIDPALWDLEVWGTSRTGESTGTRREIGASRII